MSSMPTPARSASSTRYVRWAWRWRVETSMTHTRTEGGRAERPLRRVRPRSLPDRSAGLCRAGGRDLRLLAAQYPEGFLEGTLLLADRHVELVAAGADRSQLDRAGGRGMPGRPDRDLTQLGLEAVESLTNAQWSLAVDLVYARGRGLAHERRATQLRQENRKRILAGDAEAGLEQQFVPPPVMQRLDRSGLGDQHAYRGLADGWAAKHD